MENIERMTDIKQQLRGLRSKRIKVTFHKPLSSPPPLKHFYKKYLLAGDIELLKEGKAVKMSGRTKESKYYLFLFNKMLVMSKEKTKRKFNSIKTNYHHNEVRIPL